jgi:putative redox protein
MANPLSTRIKLINQGIKFSCSSENHPEIITDYYPPLGNNEGYKPLQLFLISFGTCISGTILPLLRRMNKNISDYEVCVEGIRRDEHPTCFNKINIVFTIKSNDITESDLENVLKLAEEKYCPVWNMLDKEIKIETKFTIIK